MISYSLIKKHFDENKKILVFIDREGKKVGFKPSETKGYKITKTNNGSRRIYCMPLTKHVRGRFYPSWDNKLGMLILSYEDKDLVNRNL